MTTIEPGPPPSMRVVSQIDLRTYPRVKHVSRASLLLIGVLGLVFAFAYSPVHVVEELPAGVRFVAVHLTLWPWSIAWAFSGLYSIVSAVRPRVNVSGSAGVLSLFYVWGFGYLVTWLTTAGHNREYVLAAAYLIIATLLLLGSYVFNTALNLSRPPAAR